MKKVLSISLFFLISLQGRAQQVIYAVTEIYGPQWHNPASYGTWNKFSVNLNGQENSPFKEYAVGSVLASAEGYLPLKSSNHGVGIGLNTIYGYYPGSDNYSANAVINYQYAFDKFHISIGAAPGFRNIRFKPYDWVYYDSIAAPMPVGSQAKFMIDAGFYIFSDRFYAGISSAQINTTLYDELNYTAARHIFVNAGYRFKVAKNMQLFPSIIWGSAGGSSVFTGQLLMQWFKPGISIGGGYSNGPINALLGYELGNFSVLYAARFDNSKLTNAFLWGHELRLTYKIRRTEKCGTCPYF